LPSDGEFAELDVRHQDNRDGELRHRLDLHIAVPQGRRSTVTWPW
jgi:hypothetical protein